MSLIKLSDVIIPEVFYQSRNAGIEALDVFLSNNKGLIPSMVYLFTGVSGAGKTTISNLMLSGIGTAEMPTVFISLEMSKEQLKYQFDGKVNFSNTLIIDTDGLGTEPTIESFQDLLDSLAAHNPSAVVVDSLQMASAIIYGNPTSVAGQSALAKMITKFAKEYSIPVLVIGQCAKDGSYVGPSFLKHILDAHLHAEYNEKTGERYITFEKNRFGAVGAQLHYAFENNGNLRFFKKERISRFSQEFTWNDAKDMIQSIYAEVVAKEALMMVKRGVHVPRLVFDGELNVDYSDENYHPKTTTWMHFPTAPYFVYNTIFVDLDNARQKFTDEQVEKLRIKYAVYLDQFPNYTSPKQLFLLSFFVLLAKAVRQSNVENIGFWNTLRILIEQHG